MVDFDVSYNMRNKWASLWRKDNDLQCEASVQTKLRNNFWLGIKKYIDAADNQRLDGSKWQKSNLSTKFWMKSLNNLEYSTLNNFCQWCGVLLWTPLLQSVHQVKSIKMEFHLRPRWSSTFRLRFMKVKLEVTLMGHQVQEWSDHCFKFVMKRKNITYSWIIFSHPYDLLLELKGIKLQSNWYC